MSLNVGDKYEQATTRELNGDIVDCMGEFEVISIDKQPKEDGSMITVTNSGLVRYLD